MNNIPIISDTDCLSCFLIINQTNILEKLYDKIIIPAQVYEEFKDSNMDMIINNLNRLMDNNFIEIHDMKLDSAEHRMYKVIQNGNFTNDRKLGKGESAAISITLSKKGKLASNNTKDVIDVVKELKIKWITTGDILIKAYEEKLISEDEGNMMWKKMINKGRYLPTNSFTKYLHDDTTHPSNY